MNGIEQDLGHRVTRGMVLRALVIAAVAFVAVSWTLVALAAAQ